MHNAIHFDSFTRLVWACSEAFFQVSRHLASVCTWPARTNFAMEEPNSSAPKAAATLTTNPSGVGTELSEGTEAVDSFARLATSSGGWEDTREGKAACCTMRASS